MDFILSNELSLVSMHIIDQASLKLSKRSTCSCVLRIFLGGWGGWSFYVVLAILELPRCPMDSDSPASASWVLRLKICVTQPPTHTSEFFLKTLQASMNFAYKIGIWTRKDMFAINALMFVEWSVRHLVLQAKTGSPMTEGQGKARLLTSITPHWIKKNACVFCGPRFSWFWKKCLYSFVGKCV